MSTGSAWRHEASARRNRPPVKRQPSASQAPTKRRAVAASFAPVWWLAPGRETLSPDALFR